MSDKTVLKKGLDIPVSGKAELRTAKTVTPDTAGVCPSDFKGFSGRLLVKEGDRVLCGSPLLADKKRPEILVCSPVSGTVQAIVRGEKRKLLSVVIKADLQQQSVDFGIRNPKDLDAGQIRAALLESGLWPFIISRPYGVIANPDSQPKAVFVSAFDSAPLASDFEFAFADRLGDIQTGIDAISKLCGKPVHLSLNAANADSSIFAKLQGVQFHKFEGKHPAGNVGVQISHISPILKGETVWTVSLHGLAAIGSLFAKGKLNLRRKIAVAGSAAIQPAYADTLPGAPMESLAGFFGNSEDLRIVSGDILSGNTVGREGYLGFYASAVTVLKEGREKEYFGWLNPFRFKIFSADRSAFTWLFAKIFKGGKFDMDTNLHGGQRAFVMSDAYYSKVLPMDIYPLFLIKACLAGDIDKMEKFGIYEVIPEDLALCEYIDPSKNDIQAIIADGISLMLKEME